MLDSDEFSISHVGNGSTVTGYPIDFLFLENASYIRCAVTIGDDDEVELSYGSEFTVHQDGSNWFVRTITAYSGSDTVRVFRELPLTQPMDLQASGPLPPEAIERAFDRVVMLIQQIALAGAGASIPVEALQDVMGFLDATARGTTAARRPGQLGVQLDSLAAPLNGVLWASLTTSPGDWIKISGGLVPMGGTGLATLTPYALLAGGTTATGAMQQVGVGTAGQFLRSNGPGVLPTMQTVAIGGDVVGPAFSQNGLIAMFADGTGKLIKGFAGTNDTTLQIWAGRITDTSARPVYVQQEWDNAGLTGRLFIVNAEIDSSALGSTLTEWQVNGSNRGKVMRDGEFRALDGNYTYPIYSFDAEPGTGMFRETATGGIRHAVATVPIQEIRASEVQTFVPFTVTISGADKLYVTSTFMKVMMDVVPGTDNARDLGSALLRWRNIYFGGTLTGGAVTASNVTLTLLATSNAAPTIASAGTIAPVKAITFISGTAVISTITPPAPISSGGGQITFIPTGVFSTNTAGNIALASTAVVGKALILTYDAVTTKWYPSY